jgi:hypothetical protein
MRGLQILRTRRTSPGRRTARHDGSRTSHPPEPRGVTRFEPSSGFVKAGKDGAGSRARKEGSASYPIASLSVAEMVPSQAEMVLISTHSGPLKGGSRMTMNPGGASKAPGGSIRCAVPTLDVSPMQSLVCRAATSRTKIRYRCATRVTEPSSALCRCCCLDRGPPATSPTRSPCW